jgi:hypothetical protein
LRTKRSGRNTQWKEHPFDALDPGDGLTLYRRSGTGEIDHRRAAALLTTFACSEAFRLIHLWNAPEIAAEYLRTSDLRLSERAKVGVMAALDQADLELKSAAQVMKAAEAMCPKVGFFARAATRAAAQAAVNDYGRTVATYYHRGAVMHAVVAALFATIRGTCEGARVVAEEVVKTAGLLAGEEAFIIGINDHRPELLSPGVAQAAGELAATANIRARFAEGVDFLFERWAN